jgi:3-oxoacyl-[acyl-carrier-protein] synthase III
MSTPSPQVGVRVSGVGAEIPSKVVTTAEVEERVGLKRFGFEPGWLERVTGVRERRWARLESARTDVTEARPGDQIIVETVLAPYRGERVVRQIPVKIPTSASKGNLRILVSDGDTLDRVNRTNPAFGRKLDLASTIALLNKEHANNRLYVSLLEADPEARVADKVMPTLPISVMNVMDGMRGNQEMIVSGESNVDETATPSLDYVVSGAQVLTVTIK